MNIGICGAGWLGKQMAIYFSNNGYKVRVSHANKEKLLQWKNINILAYHNDLDQKEVDENFFKNLDILVIFLPPCAHFVFENLIHYIVKNHIKKIFITSSTGVYQGLSGDIFEDALPDLSQARVNKLVTIENLFLENNHFKTTVLRLGGLFGNQRHPVHFLKMKTIIDEGNEYVNMAKDEWIIEKIHHIIENNIDVPIINLVSHHSITKKAFYTQAAKDMNITLPPFDEVPSPKNRRVLSYYL